MRKYLLLYTVLGFLLPLQKTFATNYCNNAHTCVWESDGEGNVTISGNGSLESLQGRSSDEPIKTVTIGGSISKIREDAFRGYKTLTDVHIGKSVQSIGNEAFYGAGQNINFSIQGDEVSVGNRSFYGANSINYNTITYSCGIGCIATLTNDGHATYLGHGETVLSQGRPDSIFEVMTIDIGNGISKVNEDAFRGYKTLTDVHIGESVQSIGNEAFYGAFSNVNNFYCPKAEEKMCQDAVARSHLNTSIVGTYLKKNGYITYYDANGNEIESYKYDFGGNLIAVYKNGERVFAKRIYTIDEAVAASKGNKNTFSIIYR